MPVPPPTRPRCRALCACLALAAILLAPAAAHAQDAAQNSAGKFYAGKTIQLLIGYSAGGGYDTYARILARHMGDHIPGHPTIVPQNMPGAGSLRVVEYLAGVAPQDGTVFGTFGRGLAMEPLLAPGTTHFDATTLTWIGSITNETSICAFRTDTGIHSWKDMQQSPGFTVGGTGSGSDTDIFPLMLHNLFHLNLKLVTGYPGGNDVALALQRGEVNGRCGWSWSSLVSRDKSMLDSKMIVVTLQFALKRDPALPNVPLIMDVTKDPAQIAALKLIVSRQVMARPYAAPPGIPPDRRDALRAAFDATMTDPAFIEEAKTNDLEIRPVKGAEVEKLVRELYKSPPNVVDLAQQAIKQQP
jgi:tripartite-type tricarboxylate transporter receptor subunit TctC